MTDSAREDRPLARSDLWSGVVFAAIGLAFVVESWRMPRLEERGIDPWTIPGLVPGVLGLALGVLGVVLAIRGWRQSRGQKHHISILGTGEARIRLAATLVLNLAFALLLVGRLPFWLATLLYLAGFMGVFVLEPRKSDAVKRGLLILAVASVMTAGIVYLFETLFLVRLP
jgi:putative tricarboxylic transport membrane protein